MVKERYDIIIAVCNGAVSAGLARKKMGDIRGLVPWKRKSTTEVDHYETKIINGKKKKVAIMKDINEPFNGGRLDIEDHFIVTILSDKPLKEFIKYRKGIYINNTSMQLIGEEEADDLEEENKTLAFESRYSIPLDKLRELIPGLEEIKFTDPRYTYQPCRKATDLVEKFTGMHNNRFLTTSMVDTKTSSIEKEEEFVIDFDITEMIYDKLTGKYIN